jgi:hypothetical protein
LFYSFPSSSLSFYSFPSSSPSLHTIARDLSLSQPRAYPRPAATPPPAGRTHPQAAPGHSWSCPPGPHPATSSAPDRGRARSEEE